MTPRRLTERPQARSAARHASEPMATPRFAVFSSLLFNRWDPCKPSQNVSADMPSTTKSGSQDSTASRAGKSALRMLSIIVRSEEHTSELQSLTNLVCRLLLEKKKKRNIHRHSNSITSDT